MNMGSLLSLTDAIRSIRPILDRVEALLARLTSYRSQVEELVAIARAAHDDAWNKHANTARATRLADASPRERYAEYSAKTVAEQIALRRAEKLLTRVESAHAVVSMFMRGLESSRHDLHGLVRAQSVESRLEA